ncbi:hypothetical protein HZB03_01860 [Candidatus Woesearchaeota archaeon]|nr:hypothetical protein [Candidatus Woesearchaeota archaeon]
MAEITNGTRLLENISDIANRFDHDEYLERMKLMVLRVHKHHDNTRVELRLANDPRAAEQERIFANEQQALQQQRTFSQQKAADTEERRRTTHQLSKNKAAAQYEGREKLIHNSKIIFTCNCGKSFALGPEHGDHNGKSNDSIQITSYDESKEGKFSKINEYGLLVDAPSAIEIASADYSGDLPKANFSTGYDKQDDSQAM